MVGSVVTITIGTTLLDIRSDRAFVEESVGSNLLHAATSAAKLVDPEAIGAIEGREDGRPVDAEPFATVASVLDALAAAHELGRPGESPIYVMRPADVPGELEFVAMADVRTAGHFVGHRYATRPHLTKVLTDGVACRTSVYTDEHGHWISAAAPVRDASGEIIALVQADTHVETISQLAWERTLHQIELGFLVGGLALIASVFLSRRLTRPLQRLTDRAERVANGDYAAQPVPDDGAEEVRAVERAFELMTDGLRANSRLQTDLAEHLREERRQAEAASVAKSRFLANMSHELRTPLNAVIGFSDHLCDPDLSREEQAEAVRLIGESGQRLLAKVSDLLDISRVEDAGSAACTPFAIRPLVEGVLESFRDSPRAAGLHVQASWEDVPDIVTGDGPRLRKILSHLVDNAIDFTESGRVDVRVRVEGSEGSGELVVEVADTGCGIEAEHLENVFEPFYQVDATSTRRHQGAGVGLAVCRSLARSFGGDVTVESAAGRGSTFTVRLPQATATSARDDADPSRHLSLDGMDVLVVEDNPINQRLLVRLLEKWGGQVRIAGDGQQALDQVGRAGPRLVLMDIQMPVMDGINAIRHIRAQGLHVPIITITANASAEDERRAISAGSDAFLAKPIQAADLRRTIAQLTADAAA